MGMTQRGQAPLCHTLSGKILRYGKMLLNLQLVKLADYEQIKSAHRNRPHELECKC